MAKSRKSRSGSSKPSQAAELPLAPAAVVEPTIRLEAEPGGTWIYTAWEPGTAATHWIVDGELGRIDSRRLANPPADSVAALPALIDHQVQCWRLAWSLILAREPAAELGWRNGGVIRMTMHPDEVRTRIEQKARAKARNVTDAGETRTAAPTFAGFGDES